MKTLEDVNLARGILCIQLMDPDLSKEQRVLLNGMLNALVWVAEGKHGTTVDRLLSGERIIKPNA